MSNFYTQFRNHFSYAILLPFSTSQNFPIPHRLCCCVSSIANSNMFLISNVYFISQIAVRRCVFWNGNLSDYGVWDTTGCRVVENNAHYTKCACDKFGSFAVLAEKIPAAVSYLKLTSSFFKNSWFHAHHNSQIIYENII